MVEANHSDYLSTLHRFFMLHSIQMIQETGREDQFREVQQVVKECNLSERALIKGIRLKTD